MFLNKKKYHLDYKILNIFKDKILNIRNNINKINIINKNKHHKEVQTNNIKNDNKEYKNKKTQTEIKNLENLNIYLKNNNENKKK